ncbi:MazG-like family protein [candidate division WWE3 bacterium]|uniref:MazG-like family protein n=1 Tax=candidate division WWE3 bacterium TaxID=2053526 RepID=A0A955LL34_UNCKA|nr:MazG-like family protein [candidate division WWE3 bacterium]
MQLSEIQEKVKKFTQEYDMENPPEHRVLDLVSEIGETAKELLKMSQYGREPLKYRENVLDELGDVMYSLITVANYFNVDLDKSLDKVLEKYERRIRKGGSAGSEND